MKGTHQCLRPTMRCPTTVAFWWQCQSFVWCPYGSKLPCLRGPADVPCEMWKTDQILRRLGYSQTEKVGWGSGEHFALRYAQSFVSSWGVSWISGWRCTCYHIPANYRRRSRPPTDHLSPKAMLESYPSEAYFPSQRKGRSRQIRVYRAGE